jgi:hypothetical protein
MSTHRTWREETQATWDAYVAATAHEQEQFVGLACGYVTREDVRAAQDATVVAYRAARDAADEAIARHLATGCCVRVVEAGFVAAKDGG